MKNKNIFVACDTSNLSEIKKIIKHTQANNLKLFPNLVYNFSIQKLVENIYRILKMIFG